MEITKFKRLQLVIARLGADPVVAELDKRLQGEGISLDHPERVIVGKTGLYYIDPRGKIVRALLYIVNRNIKWGISFIVEKTKQMVLDGQFQNPELIESCHKYHILNCDTLIKAQAEGWQSKYHAANRRDGTFFYRFLDGEVILAESKKQHLLICRNCLKLLSELTRRRYSRDRFSPGDFFSLDIGGLFSHRVVDPNCPPAADVYGPDWPEISERYKAMKGYKCEGESCPHQDLSSPNLKRYLHCHHIDRDKGHNTFFNLKALCIYCHAQQPQHSHVRSSPDYKKYMKLIGLQ